MSNEPADISALVRKRRAAMSAFGQTQTPTHSTVLRQPNSSGLLDRLGVLDGMARFYPRLYSTKQRSDLLETCLLEMFCCSSGGFLIRAGTVHNDLGTGCVTLYNRIDIFGMCENGTRDDAILHANLSRPYIENDQFLASID